MTEGFVQTLVRAAFFQGWISFVQNLGIELSGWPPMVAELPPFAHAQLSEQWEKKEEE